MSGCTGTLFLGLNASELKIQGSTTDQLPEGNEQVACRMGMVSTSNDGYCSRFQSPKTLDPGPKATNTGN